MIYEEKKNNAIYFYNVTYDKEKLKKILERLEKYTKKSFIYLLYKRKTFKSYTITRNNSTSY